MHFLANYLMKLSIEGNTLNIENKRQTKVQKLQVFKGPTNIICGVLFFNKNLLKILSELALKLKKS